MIEFETLAMKADTNKLHAIFLLKKIVWLDIIKIILEYPPIAAPETLKKWKVAITSVGQEYESTEGLYDYKTEIGTTYGGRGLFMDIGKLKENFNNGKPRYFNCNLYEYIVKDCWRLKKEKDNRKYYKYKCIGYITKDCRTKQMKNQSFQEETNTEEENKKQSFGEYSK